MAPINECAGCRNVLPRRDFLSCTVCKSKYDLECANILPKAYTLMTIKQRAVWKCPECCSKAPKRDNSNTPLRPGQCSEIEGPSVELTAEHSSPKSVVKTIEPKVDSPLIAAELKSPSQTRGPETLVTESSLRVILQQEITIALKSTLEKIVAAEFSNIHRKIDSFQESLEFMNVKFEEMKAGYEEKTALIHDLKRENEFLNSTIRDISARLNTVELHMRDSNLEINGIPEHRSENLVNTVVQLSKIVESPLSDNDIQYATRVAKMSNDNDRPRPVIVKLRTARLRDNILAATTKFNRKTSDDKLSTQHLGLGGPRKPVFVAEHLTPANKSLHAAARKKAKEMSYKFVWVRNGRIFVRRDVECQSIVIRNLESLNLIV